jgi:hypothetical protein
MQSIKPRLILPLTGALLGVLSQVNWLLWHDWDDTPTRLLLGLAFGGAGLWVVSELLAVFFRMAGRDFWQDLLRFKASLSKTSTLRIVGVFWLVFVGGFTYGWVSYSSQSGPYNFLINIHTFLFVDQDLGVLKKLVHDLGFTPYRHLVDAPAMPVKSRNYQELGGLSLQEGRKAPLIYLSPDAPKGYRLIFGSFYFKETIFGVILLDENGKVAHVWNVSQEGIPWEHRPDRNVLGHGLEISPQGELYIGYDHGSCLTKYDWCGKALWRIKGHYHHSVAFESPDVVWCWGDPGDESGSHENLVKVSTKDGKILKSIHLSQIMKANPDIDIFGIRQLDSTTESKWIEDGGGYWHANDIEPLPQKWAHLYPGFNPGDLLVCLRSPNLIFVMDPETLKVKWWRQGQVRRPHDPDWNHKGTITIYNNNMNRGFSSIVEIDPKTFASKELLKGGDYDFYSPVRGKHQLLPDGGILVTSAQQGKVFEVDAKGKVVFELINRYEDGKTNLMVSEARFVPLDYFKNRPKCN